MQPMADFIQRRCLTDFTTLSQADLLHAFFYTAYETVICWGREQAVQQAQSGMLTNVLRGLIHGECFNDFPWMLAEMELSAIGTNMVEDIDDMLQLHELTAYSPLPNVEKPNSMMLELTHEC